MKKHICAVSGNRTRVPLVTSRVCYHCTITTTLLATEQQSGSVFCYLGLCNNRWGRALRWYLSDVSVECQKVIIHKWCQTSPRIKEDESRFPRCFAREIDRLPEIARSSKVVDCKFSVAKLEVSKVVKGWFLCRI